MADKESNRALELSVDERAGLKQIAAGEPPYSQRAQALLALADGADLAEAGGKAGLTANQARYWLGRFGTRRLTIFPEDLLAIQVPEEVEPDPPMLAAPEKAPLLEAPELAGELPESIPDSPKAAAADAGGTMAVKTKKKKKAKKDKKAKKSKKEKKGKKKAKKSKKEKKDKKSKKSKKDKKNKKDKKKKK